MDLNYLFHRQQVERAKAESAGSEIARAVHSELAAEYEKQIDRFTSGRFIFSDGARAALEARPER